MERTSPDELVKFYKDEPNASGYTFSEVIGWDDRQLEEVHDFIQWLFPIPEPSRFNPDAPILTAKVVTALRHPDLAERVLVAEQRIRRFLDLAEIRSDSVPGRPHWATPGNHNLLRISRIIRFLNLVCGNERAKALLSDAKCCCIGMTALNKSKEFWERAAE